MLPLLPLLLLLFLLLLLLLLLLLFVCLLETTRIHQVCWLIRLGVYTDPIREQWNKKIQSRSAHPTVVVVVKWHTTQSKPNGSHRKLVVGRGQCWRSCRFDSRRIWDFPLVRLRRHGVRVVVSPIPIRISSERKFSHFGGRNASAWDDEVVAALFAGDARRQTRDGCPRGSPHEGWAVLRRNVILVVRERNLRGMTARAKEIHFVASQTMNDACL